MATINDLMRQFYLRMLGLSNSNLSVADLETQLYSDTSFNAGIRKVSVPMPTTGSYFFPASQGSHTTSAALGNNTLRAYPFILEDEVTINRLGTEVTVVGEAGSKIRLGIYADDGTGKPGALVLEAGQINGDSATVQELTFANITLTPGVYWGAGVVQLAPTTQPTLRCVNSACILVPTIASLTMPTTASSDGGYIHDSAVAGALPATYLPTSQGSVTPRLFLKVA